MKTPKIKDQIKNEIINGKFGASGTLFPNTETLMDLYDISFVSALKIINDLIKERLLIKIGNKKYIVCGIYSKQSDLYRITTKSNDKKIGIILRSISNPYYSIVSENLYQLAHKNGYDFVIKLTTIETEADALFDLIREGVLGIFSFSPENTSHTIELYSRLPIPVVFIGKDFPYKPSNCVKSNNYASGYHAAKHLHECGYTSLYYIQQNAIQSGSDSRKNGFFAYCKEHSLSCNIDTPLFCDIKNKENNNHIVFTLKNDKDKRIGLFCFHDLIAINLFELLSYHKFNIPEALGLVGYDKIDNISPYSSQITTFSYSFKDIAINAWNLLQENIENLNMQPKIIEIPTILVIRASTIKLQKT